MDLLERTLLRLPGGQTLQHLGLPWMIQGLHSLTKYLWTRTV